MILASENIGFERLMQIINQRATQIILICLFSMFSCQLLKFIISSIRNKEINANVLFSTGGFPSSHSSLVMTLVTSLLLFQLHDINGVDWSFAVAVVYALIIIHDAMGVRLEASKHAKILNNLTVEMPLEEKKEIGFGKKGFLKEMLGHKGIEVFAGVIYGIVVGVFGYLLWVDKI